MRRIRRRTGRLCDRPRIATHNRAWGQRFSEANAENRWRDGPAVRGMLPALWRRAARHRVSCGSAVVGGGHAVALCQHRPRRLRRRRAPGRERARGHFPVPIVKAEFPNRQRLAETTDLTLLGVEQRPATRRSPTSRSRSSRLGPQHRANRPASPRQRLGERRPPTAPPRRRLRPTLASRSLRAAGLANPSRPVWILEDGLPEARRRDRLGRRRGGADQHLRLRRARPGRDPEHRLEADAGPGRHLHDPLPGRRRAPGQGKAVTTDGSVPEGEFVVAITDTPAADAGRRRRQGRADQAKRHHRPGRHRASRSPS